MDKARMAAAKALIKVEEKGGYSNLSLDTLLSQSGLPPPGQGLCGGPFLRRFGADADTGQG